MANPNYYAIIPADVRYCDRIPASAKLLYGEISSLCDASGVCVEPNGYFADLYRMTTVSISRLISALEKEGFIHTEQLDATRVIRLAVSACRGLSAEVEDGEPYQNCYAPLTKMISPLNKNDKPTGISKVSAVVGDINNNISTTEEKKKESKKKKESPGLNADQMQRLFITWIADSFPDADRTQKNRLYKALDDFYAPRERKDQDPQHTARGFNGLKGKLERSCGSDVSAMLDMLDTATSAGWKSVFPERGAPSQKERTKEVRYGFDTEQ